MKNVETSGYHTLEYFISDKKLAEYPKVEDFLELFEDAGSRNKFRMIFCGLLKGKDPKRIINAMEKECIKHQKEKWLEITENNKGNFLKHADNFSVYWSCLKDHEKYGIHVRKEVIELIFEGCSRIVEGNMVVGVHGSFQKGYGDYGSDIDLFVIYEEKPYRKANVYGLIEAFTIAGTLALGYLPCGSYQINPHTNISKASYYRLDTIEQVFQSSSENVKFNSPTFWENIRKTVSTKINKIAKKQTMSDRLFLFNEVFTYYKQLYSVTIKNPLTVSVHDIFKCMSYYADSKMLGEMGLPEYMINNTFRKKSNVIARKVDSIVGLVGALIVESEYDTRYPLIKLSPTITRTLRKIEDILNPQTIKFEF